MLKWLGEVTSVISGFVLIQTFRIQASGNLGTVDDASTLVPLICLMMIMMVA